MKGEGGDGWYSRWKMKQIEKYRTSNLKELSFKDVVESLNGLADCVLSARDEAPDSLRLTLDLNSEEAILRLRGEWDEA